MGFWMIVILANLIVGVLVGLTGVAGPSCTPAPWAWACRKGWR